jgi:hypothetical protein
MSASDSVHPDQFRTLYHGVYDDGTLPAIQKEGLQPQRLPEVYTSPDFKTAGFFANHHVLEIAIPPSEIKAEEPGSVVSGPIDPSRIRQVHTRRDDQTWGGYWSDRSKAAGVAATAMLGGKT